MPAVKTASQRGTANRRKGIKAELDMCTYLRPWWPDVDRTQRTGYRNAVRSSRDWGDIAGTPGIIWSVKGWGDVYPKDITLWCAELQQMRLIEAIGDAPAIRLLVVKNNGHANPADWWCWQPLWQLIAISTAMYLEIPEPGGDDLVRTQLSTVVHRLRIMGYGIPLEDAA